MHGRRSSRVAPAPDALGLRALIDASADSASLADSGMAQQNPACTQVQVTAGRPHVTLLSMLLISYHGGYAIPRDACL